jgi:hypothetical protein
MNESYTKLYSTITASSIWRESKEVKILWVTMLAMADRFGDISASVPGLAVFAGLTIPECEASLNTLLAPDPFSRSQTYEGRRIEIVEGGWHILNYAKYRERRDPDKRREQNREAQERYRKSHSKPNVSHNKPNVSPSRSRSRSRIRNNSTQAAQLSDFVPLWNLSGRLPKVETFTQGRRDAFCVRMSEKMFADNWRTIIEKMAASDFLCGGGERHWRADIDWLLKDDTNYVKVLEGKFDNTIKPEPKRGEPGWLPTEEEYESIMKETK